jgi:hypothetical protein
MIDDGRLTIEERSAKPDAALSSNLGDFNRHSSIINRQ